MLMEKIICAGFGGQGVMSLGQLLAYGAMYDGYEVTWMPAYGPEMRGGTAYCGVVISETPVGSPLITDDVTCAIVMNLPSLTKFESKLIPGGLLLVNSSLVDKRPSREDVLSFYLPVVEEAAMCGDQKMANIIMLGAYLELTGIITRNNIIKAIKKVFGSKSKGLLTCVCDALDRGAQLVHDDDFIPAAA
jgi:2-oxoglutarate ferredoxin oxidoreductase subunit gamma